MTKHSIQNNLKYFFLQWTSQSRYPISFGLLLKANLLLKLIDFFQQRNKDVFNLRLIQERALCVNLQKKSELDLYDICFLSTIFKTNYY